MSAKSKRVIESFRNKGTIRNRMNHYQIFRGRSQGKLVQQLKIMHYLYDLDENRFISVSDGSEALLGYTPEEVVRMGMEGFIDAISEADCRQINDLYDSFPREAELITQVAYHFTRKDKVQIKLAESRFLVCSGMGLPGKLLVGTILQPYITGHQ